MPQSPDPIRWGIVGTANIARAQFLPGLREAGGGRATLVASRDLAKAEAYATAHGIDQGIEGYAALVESPDIDAVYVALPNALHAEPTIRALRAGKAVLCEKPLSVGAAQTKDVLDVAATAAQPLWEAFVFPFQAQHQRLKNLLEDGAIGEPGRALQRLPLPAVQPGQHPAWTPRSAAARWPTSAATPSASAFELFGGTTCATTGEGSGAARPVTENGVDTDAAGIVTFGPARRLLLSCGFKRSYDTFTSVLGTRRPDPPDQPVPSQPGRHADHPSARTQTP